MYPWMCPWGALLRRTVEKRAYTSIILISKCFDVLALHACMHAVHKLSRFPIRITFYCELCAKWNADVIGADTAYETIVDKCFVLCVGIVMPVQETRPHATAVASILMCYVWLLLCVLTSKMMLYFLKDLTCFFPIPPRCSGLGTTYCRSIYCDRMGSPTSQVHVRNLFWIWSWKNTG